MLKNLTYYLFISLFIFLSACAGTGEFSDIGTNIASPSSMAIDAVNNRLYVVNSNNAVLYDWTQGSVQAYDISTPTAPVLLKTTQTSSFSGEIYIDPVTNRAYIPNRYAVNSSGADVLYNFDVNTASADYLSYSSTSLGANAFAIDCCYPANRAWITTSVGELQYVDLTGDLTPLGLSLITTLDSGFLLNQIAANQVVIIGQQAFVSRLQGGVMVINLDEASVAGAAPVDYFISDIETPSGLATDGALLYVSGQGNVGDAWTQYLLVINPATLTPLTSNTVTTTIDKDTSGILTATVTVGNNPQGVVLSTAYIFVANQNDDTVSVIDRTTNTVVKTISVGDEPVSLAVLNDTHVYVGNVVSNTISIIDIATLSVAATYPWILVTEQGGSSL